MRCLFVWLVIMSTNIDSFAQFYNGHQMSFGKNRVQFIEPYHQFYRYDNFDVYFYSGGEFISKQIADIAHEEIKKAERFFGTSLQKRLIFVSYKKLSDFRGSNIGYDTHNENSNIGGSTKIINNKVLIFYEGEQQTLRTQIKAGITRLMISEMLYSGSYRQKITNSTLITLPEWYIEGLVSYLSENWNSTIENRVKDGFASGKYKRINHLTGDDAKYAGHSFWYFLGETYGNNIIPNLLYVTRLNKNTEAGFKSLLGASVKDLSPEWKKFYSDMLERTTENTENPEANSEQIVAKKNRLIRELKLSPDNRYISYISNKKGQYKIYLYDKDKDKKKRMVKRGHPLDQITDYSIPVTAWHPNGDIFSYMIEEKGNIYYYTYNLKEKETTRTLITYFDKVLSYNYSHDGLKLVLSGVKNGKTDIYIYDHLTNKNYKITDDVADDLYPVFSAKSERIIFSSDRQNTLLSSQSSSGTTLYDLFEYDYKNKAQTLKRITNTPYTNEIKPIEISKNKFVYLSDKNGIYNRYIAEFDSTISSVDTTIHYRYFSKQKQLTNYSRNIEDYALKQNSKETYEVIYYGNRYRILNKRQSGLNKKFNDFVTKNKRQQTEDRKYKDSLAVIAAEAKRVNEQRINKMRKNPPQNIQHPDSSRININNYIFETEKENDYYSIHPIENFEFKKELKDEKAESETFNYKTNFYTNHVIQQVDFGMLNSSYQAFTGSAYYFNPGINIFTKVGAYDLFEDYRVTAGFKLGGDLNSYEFLLSLEDLKARTDKQYIYHRQTQMKIDYDEHGFPFYNKIISNEGMYITKFPLNQVAAFKATLNFRYDKTVRKSTDYSSLTTDDTHKAFAGTKGEFIFDNTRNLGLNLYEGVKFKAFSEFYQEVDQSYTNFITAGFDFRYYKKIHRNLIFASRMGAGTSFGKSKLLYYLGGVDNWYSLLPDKEMFDRTVNINYDENYVYQAVATNMRGFVQNARNGNSFFVINNEIRFPVVRYLLNRPLNSDFLNNFQIVGFADAGASWSGKSPYDEKNKYLTETITQGPITVVINKNRWPVILGYGVGVRSRLFGYFFRLDWSWGLDNDHVHDRVFYFSLNLDF
ncbi:MAG: hypothetical protein U9N85_10245 [Bacteroidota bacterium]|nr:hypothetical protein [Bacteroidota bacterium]